MTALIIVLALVAIVSIVLFTKKKKLIEPQPTPTPIPQPIYYPFEVLISDNEFNTSPESIKFGVLGLHYDFCSNTEYINYEGVFSNYNSSQQLYLFHDNKKVEVRKNGENAVGRMSDCIEVI